MFIYLSSVLPISPLALPTCIVQICPSSGGLYFPCFPIGCCPLPCPCALHSLAPHALLHPHLPLYLTLNPSLPLSFLPGPLWRVAAMNPAGTLYGRPFLPLLHWLTCDVCECGPSDCLCACLSGFLRRHFQGGSSNHHPSTLLHSVTFLQGENTNSLWQSLIQVFVPTLQACSL